MGGSKGSRLPFFRDFVVPASGALFCHGLLFRLPLGLHKFVSLEPAKGGVDGAAGKAGNLHDIEAIAVAEADCLEDEGRGMGETRDVHGYVVCYHE